MGYVCILPLLHNMKTTIITKMTILNKEIIVSYWWQMNKIYKDRDSRVACLSATTVALQHHQTFQKFTSLDFVFFHFTDLRLLVF